MGPHLSFEVTYKASQGAHLVSSINPFSPVGVLTFIQALLLPVAKEGGSH